MRPIRYLVFVMCFLLTGCYTGIPVDAELEQHYKQAKSYFPKYETRFLPELKSGKLLVCDFGMPTVGSSQSPIYIHIVMKYSKEMMDSILFKTYSANIIYSFNDENLLVLDYDPKKIKHFPNLKMIKDTLDLSPIPNFDFLQNGIWGSGYKDEARIYNFSWSRGSVLPEELLRIDKAGLPEGWEHGLTSGVTIWKNYVAYWLDAW